MIIKKEVPSYFSASSNSSNSPLMGGHSPGPGRPPAQQPCTNTVPGAKSSPVPMSQSSPLTPQQQFNARKAPTPTSNNNNNSRTPPPAANSVNVQFSQTQQQQMQMNMNGQQIQVITNCLQTTRIKKRVNKRSWKVDGKSGVDGWLIGEIEEEVRGRAEPGRPGRYVCPWTVRPLKVTYELWCIHVGVFYIHCIDTIRNGPERGMSIRTGGRRMCYCPPPLLFVFLHLHLFQFKVYSPK